MEYWDDSDDYDDDWDEEPEEDFMAFCMYQYKSGSFCGQRTIGEGCEQCGTPLCPMHMETGANFCNTCPTDDYVPYYLTDQV